MVGRRVRAPEEPAVLALPSGRLLAVCRACDPKQSPQGMTNGLKPSRRGFACRRGSATVTNSRPWIDHLQSGRGPSRTIGRHRRRSLGLDGLLAPHCRHLFPAAGTPGACPQTDAVIPSHHEACITRPASRAHRWKGRRNSHHPSGLPSQPEWSPHERCHCWVRSL